MSTKNDKTVLETIFNPFLSGDCFDEDDNQESSDPSENNDLQYVSEAKRLEIEGVNAANGSDLGKAIEYFNRAIEIAPNRASGYNNRAQALRLKGDINGALDDLNKAIVLSEGKGKAGSQALCQRGLVYKLVGKNSEALNDFECAAKLGNQFAKSIIVQTNPYAALCNQMLRDIMSNIHRGNERQEDQSEH